MIHKLATKDYTCAMKKSLSVTYTSPLQQPRAEAFARQQQLPCMPEQQVDTMLLLRFTDEFVELRDLQAPSAIHVDFIGGSLAHRRKYGGGRGQAIARAIGLKPGTAPPRVLDATAGLGKDAFVLACLGCPLTLVERSPVVALLVDDAIERARDEADFANILATGFQLIKGNALDVLQALGAGQRPEVIYLDPMYPERKKTAQVKKNMQLLQKLLGQDEDTEQLLAKALQCATKRVVVKRPKGAASIPGHRPTTCIESKKTRYDVYVTSLVRQL
jgi:16S rRNA (guanine1516-N2)-methyltransferase